MFEIKASALQDRFVEYKDFIRERDLKSNKFHHEEVHDLHERLHQQVRDYEEKDAYYMSIEKTIRTIENTIPKLMQEKFDLARQVEEEEHRNVFLRNEMIKMKHKHLRMIGEE